ncbi:MAG TPA: helix-turn-helix domain-containing protein [Casimicrobiaceae bacterium]|nr:helix-turn-helix domain-containing protein [Casimicrobiaceae bacterium]
MPARNKVAGARAKVVGKPPRKRKAAPARTPARTAGGEAGVIGVARQLRAWTDSVLGVAGAAADISIGAAKALLVKPGQRAALERAGALLRRMRETAGLSVREVTDAIDLEDPALLELVENGRIALPFEIVLRLASVLGRNDPLSFVMRFTRSYNPDVWRTLESLGVGRLVVQAGREREFANIYRGSDAARRLSDEDFTAALAFTRQAFELALAFRGGRAGGARRTGTGA